MGVRGALEKALGYNHASISLSTDSSMPQVLYFVDIITDNFLWDLLYFSYLILICVFYFLAYKGIDKRNRTTGIGGEAPGTVSPNTL